MSFTLIDSSAAGALIPTEAAASVIKAAAEQSVALQLARRVRMTTRDFEQPILSETVEAYWVQAGERKMTDSASWEGVMLHAEELAVIVVADLDVIDDSSVNIWAELQGEFGTAIAKALDAAVIGGINRPASWPPSIVEGATTAGQVIDVVSPPAAGGVYGDLALVLDELETASVDATGWAAKRALRGMMRRARAADGQLLGDYSLDSAWDLPFTWAIGGTLGASTLVVAGDWSQAVVGIRQDMRVEMFREGVIQDGAGAIVANLLQEDRAAVRLTFRAGYATANPVRRTETGNVQSFPFAVLTDTGVQGPEPDPGTTETRRGRKGAED